MIHLYTSYYIDSNPERQREIEECLERNVACEAIDTITLLIESPCYRTFPDKVTTVLIPSRPTYATFFRIINEQKPNKDWHIVANTDIYFDDTLLSLNDYKNPSEVALALSRWDVLKRGVQLYNRPDSQDVWVFHSKVMNCSLSDVRLGMPGCDNAIAYALHKSGYKVLNVAKNIRTYHLHLSGVRGYDHKDKVQQPYKSIPITDDLCLR